MAKLSSCLTRLCMLFGVVLLHGCVSSPSQKFSKTAVKLGLHEQIISTKGFELATYLNRAAIENSSKELHIYIDGDGQPFIREHYINADPTSSNRLMLELVTLDSSPSLLLGRPCYHQVKKSANCIESRWWTSHRYSEDVLKSLSQAIQTLQQRYKKPRLTLIGFSGGGTLAVLLADRIETVDTLITINANLDTKAWTNRHNYSPLSGSLNPSERADLRDNITKHYLIGQKDKNVIASDWLDKFSHQENTTIHKFADYDHDCCWAEIWQTFLSENLP